MKILAIDTATDILGVALTEDTDLMVECRLNLKRAHAEKLLVTVDKILNEAQIKLKELTAIAVSIGPGSFTGLRIGLAVVKGLAFAANLPVVAVPTLDALVLQARGYPFQICPLIKAQADEAYFAFYHFERQKLIRDSDYQLVDIKFFKELITQKNLILNVNVRSLYHFIAEDRTGLIEFAPPEMCKISGYTVAQIALQKLAANEVENIDLLEPFYLKNFKAKKKIGL